MTIIPNLGFLNMLNDFHELIVVIGISILCIVVLKYVLGHREKTNKQKKKISPPCKIFVPLNPRSYLAFVREIANKISDNRQHLQNWFTLENSALCDDTLQKLKASIYSAEKTMCTALIQKSSAQDQHAEEILATLEALQSDFVTLQKQFRNVVPDLSDSGVTDSDEEPPSSDEVENGEDSYRKVNVEVLNSIAQASEECFEKLTSEAKSKGKEIIQDLARFLEQSRKEIQKEMAIFTSVAAENEENGSAETNFTLIAEVEKVEKHLLETFILLNRQRFEMENLYKTLKFFDRRFSCVASKFDTFWEQIKATNNSATQRLEKTEGIWSCTDRKMDMSSRCLVHQVRILKDIICDMQKDLKNRQNTVSVSNSEELDTNPEINQDHAITPLFDKMEDCHKILSEFWSINENVKEKLYSLTQLSSNLESLEDLVKGMAAGYESLFKSLLILDKGSAPQSVKDPDMSEDFSDRYEFDAPCTRLDENNDCIVCLETCQAWTIEMDLDKIMFLLKDVVKTAWDIAEQEQFRFDISKMFGQNEDLPGHDQMNSEWGNSLSECLLNDISSDWLVQNSDDSDSISKE